MYHAPSTLTDALEIAAAFGGKVIAGGTDVFPAAKQGQMADSFLDVTGIADFKTISHGPAGTRIGAAVTWSQIVQAALPPAFDALKQAAREVGGVQIQNAGTLAGNLCNASPAADGVPPLLSLEASVEVSSQGRGVRLLPLHAFLLGVRKTALAADELVTAIVIPPVPDGAVSAFEKLGSRKYLVISITMTSALVVCDAAGRITQARIAVGACSPVAQRLGAVEARLIGHAPEAVQVDPADLSALSPIDDVRGSKDFRRDVVARQIERAVRGAVQNG